MSVEISASWCATVASDRRLWVVGWRNAMVPGAAPSTAAESPPSDSSVAEREAEASEVTSLTTSLISPAFEAASRTAKARAPWALHTEHQSAFVRTATTAPALADGAPDAWISVGAWRGSGVEPAHPTERTTDDTAQATETRRTKRNDIGTS